MKISIYNIFFLIAAICFVALICFVQNVGGSYQHYTLTLNTLLAVIYYCLLEGFNGTISSKAVAGNVEKIFRNLIALGIITLVCIGICVGITYFSVTASFQQSLYILPLCGALLYLTYAFVLYKKLVHLRKTKPLQRTWLALNFIIYIGLAIMLLKGFIPQWSILVNSALLFVALILIIIIVPNNKWIAFIDRKTKITCVFYLAILELIIISLSLISLSLPIENQLQNLILANNFVLIILGFFLLYNLFSLLTLLFNWPLFSTLDSQMQAIKDFQHINNSIIRKQDHSEVYKWLFNVTTNATNADAVFLNIIDKKDNKNITTKAFGLNTTDCDTLKEGINWKKHKNPLTYFPELKNTNLKYKDYQSGLLVSLYYQKRHLANVLLYKKIESGFDSYMINLVKSYTDQAQLLIESTDLFEKNIQSERLSAELNTARRVQRALFPTDYPNSPYFEISGYSESASEIGGDYFDYLVLDDSRLAVVMADVSGSGASAALYMAELKGMFQGLIRLNLPVEMFLGFCNEALSNCMERASFITLTFCLFDFENGRMEYCRAGHTPLLHYSIDDGSSSFLVDEGMGLAMIRNERYNQFIKVYQRNLVEGDIYVLYTDGLSDEKNKKGEAYGEERLRYGLDKYYKQGCEEIVASLIEDHVLFTDEFGEKDDRSLLVIKVK